MKHKKIVTWLLSCLCVVGMGAFASACSLTGDDSSVKPSSSSSSVEISSSTPDEISSEEESSSTPDEISSEEESSSMPDEISSEEESSSTPDEISSEEESSSTPDESSEEESSSTPDESSEEESSSTPDESSSDASSTTPDESSKKDDTSKPDETSSKEESSSTPDESSSKKDDSSVDTTQQYTLYIQPERYIRTSDLQKGGSIYNADGENIDYNFIKRDEGSSYTATAVRTSNEYFFLGWYYAEDLDDVTEETFISDETTYTFTIDKDLSVYAVFAYKEDPVRLALDTNGYTYKGGYSYKNGELTLTLVKQGDTTLKDPEDVKVYGVFPTGKKSERYGTSQYKIDKGGFDINTVGTYTITYTYRYNGNIKATLVVKVVEDAHTLTVSSTGKKCLEFSYNGTLTNGSVTRELPTGKSVTLTAKPKDGYAFTGWYDENDKLVSDELIYIFKMPDADVTLYGKYESASTYLKIDVSYYQGELVDELGNAYAMGDSWTIYCKTGTEFNLTVREKGGYDFVGWFENSLDGSSSTFLTMDKTISVTVDESKYVEAKFNERFQDIKIDEDELSDAGFVDGTLAVAVGDDPVDCKNFSVTEVTFEGYNRALDADKYTVDGEVDFNVAGTYTITYTYRGDAALKAQLKIVVIDPSTEQFTFEKGYSYLDHEYDGKATFISLRDVKLGDVSLYEVKSTSKIWEKISYQWIDTATGEAVDTTDVDITINGTVVENYGPENYKMTIGNEFGGPIKAGTYRFELSYNGAVVFTQNSTIKTQIYKKITTKEEFKSNEGSMWVNFELYYYTIIGYADGKYYVMQMPSIWSGVDGNYEVEAREISLDANGNAIVGDGNDFAFVNVRYYTNDYSGYTEFLTGYYGSYVAYVSSDTTDGTTWGMPNIHRTGYTHFGSGKIYRDYGKKEYYGMTAEFAENGAVSVYSRYYGEKANRLRLVKDGDKYVFTTVTEADDTRESYDIFIYRTIIDTTVEDTSNK